MAALAMNAQTLARRRRAGHTWRTLKRWLPLGVALTLAAAGLLALAITAVRWVDEALPPDRGIGEVREQIPAGIAAWIERIG